MKYFFCLSLLMSACLLANDPLEIPNNETLELDRIHHLEQKLNALEQKIQTQKSELKMLKESIVGDHDTDARLIVAPVEPGKECVIENLKVMIDGKEVKPNFDSFLKEGQHAIKADLTCGYNNKVFTYMNQQNFAVTDAFEVLVKAGNTTYINFKIVDKQLVHDFKIVPHTQRGRGILPVSDVPHLLPGSIAQPAKILVLVGNNVSPKAKLAAEELVLDGKRLKNAKVLAEMAEGTLIYEGSSPAGNHDLKATLRFDLKDGSAISFPYMATLALQPGFKTIVILGKNRKVQVKHEAL